MNETYKVQVQGLVDDLKAVFTHAGLGGEVGEYKLLTQSFLYKFLNDNFLYQAKVLGESNTYENLLAMSEQDYDWLLEDIGTSTAWLKPDQLIETLHRQQNEATFYETFEKTLNQIAIDNNDIFSVHTDGDTAIRIFDERLITDTISDSSKRNEVAKSIINLLARVKFDENIFSQGFDFFSTLFEYMIKDYNKDGGGKYAEYYTPHSVAKIIADILVGNDQPSNVRIYDPSAGSGTLLMNLASRIGVDKTTVYSQDISQKSSNLLRLNLILNGLQHSIHNIVQGNTIIANRHPEKMDYIVSNPPFKLDFSEWRDQVETLPEASERFFAGVPKVPANSKDKMDIFLLFIQHIIYSLKSDGQAAIVVPTGFITAQKAIEKKSVNTWWTIKCWQVSFPCRPISLRRQVPTSPSSLSIRKTRVMSFSSMPQTSEPRSRKARTKRPCCLLRKSSRSSRPLSRRKPSRIFLSPSLMRTSRRKTTLLALVNTLTSR